MSNGKEKERIDILLVARGLVATREKGRALILAGDVLVDNTPVTKSGATVSVDSEIRLRSGSVSRFVSRGGDKLDGALVDFNVTVEGQVCIDLGASTGGFTDCLLQRNASLVYAIDVGTNQLDYRIRSDNRVRVYEQTHASSLSSISFTPVPTFAVIDVSFIGLRKVLPYLVNVLPAGAHIIMLIKPQFELEPERIGQGGILKNAEDAALAIERIRDVLVLLELKELGLVASRLKGKKSENQEFFMYVQIGRDIKVTGERTF